MSHACMICFVSHACRDTEVSIPHNYIHGLVLQCHIRAWYAQCHIYAFHSHVRTWDIRCHVHALDAHCNTSQYTATHRNTLQHTTSTDSTLVSNNPKIQWEQLDADARSLWRYRQRLLLCGALGKPTFALLVDNQRLGSWQSCGALVVVSCWLLVCGAFVCTSAIHLALCLLNTNWTGVGGQETTENKYKGSFFGMRVFLGRAVLFRFCWSSKMGLGWNGFL